MLLLHECCSSRTLNKINCQLSERERNGTKMPPTHYTSLTKCCWFDGRRYLMEWFILINAWLPATYAMHNVVDVLTDNCSLRLPVILQTTLIGEKHCSTCELMERSYGGINQSKHIIFSQPPRDTCRLTRWRGINLFVIYPDQKDFYIRRTDLCLSHVQKGFSTHKTVSGTVWKPLKGVCSMYSRPVSGAVMLPQK